MSLPAPNLDDRRFQDIVDEAKRRITRHCPGWTDHNVSDPGVALIELFAWMTEMILYRINQVPDRLYVKFLELVGIELFSASPARTDLLFFLAAPVEDPMRIPARTEVGTERGSDEDQIVFMTDDDLLLNPPVVNSCLVRSGTRFEDHTEDLRLDAAQVSCFPSLQVGDALYLGFENRLGGNLLQLDIGVANVEGAGIDPTRPPRTWQSWDGTDWRDARILSDTSDGFNASGEVRILLHRDHEPLAIGSIRAHWVRCKLISTGPDQPTYHVSPILSTLEVFCLGGAVRAHHAEPAPAELLGVSNGRPDQAFEVRRAPVLTRTLRETVRVVPPRSEIGIEPEATDWLEVADFSDATEADQVFTWSGATGEIRFGPRVLDRTGRPRQYGAIPVEDSQIWVTGYRYGGGQRGNVGPKKLTVMLTAVPSVESVANLDPATGGVDAETVANAKLRGPQYLRGGHRAVTAKDFERLTLEAGPGVARARCLPPANPGEPARLLIVPRVEVPPERLALRDLGLPESLENSVKTFLDARRLLTTRVRIDVPSYQGIMIAAEVHAASTTRAERIRTDAEFALYRFINPVTGGPEGGGWPFDLDLSVGDVFAVLRAVPGVVRVEAVRIFLADLHGDLAPEEASQRVRLAPEALFMSVRHRVVVRQ